MKFKFELEVDAPEFNKTDKFENSAYALDILEQLFQDARSSCLMGVVRLSRRRGAHDFSQEKVESFIKYQESKISLYDQIQATIKKVKNDS